MSFAGINYVAVVLAAVVAFVIGWAWYSALGTRWMKAARIEKGQGRPLPGLLVTSSDRAAGNGLGPGGRHRPPRHWPSHVS